MSQSLSLATAHFSTEENTFEDAEPGRVQSPGGKTCECALATAGQHTKWIKSRCRQEVYQSLWMKQTQKIPLWEKRVLKLQGKTYHVNLTVMKSVVREQNPLFTLFCLHLANKFSAEPNWKHLLLAFSGTWPLLSSDVGEWLTKGSHLYFAQLEQTALTMTSPEKLVRLRPQLVQSLVSEFFNLAAW